MMAVCGASPFNCGSVDFRIWGLGIIHGPETLGPRTLNPDPKEVGLTFETNTWEFNFRNGSGVGLPGGYLR